MPTQEEYRRSLVLMGVRALFLGLVLLPFSRLDGAGLNLHYLFPDQVLLRRGRLRLLHMFLQFASLCQRRVLLLDR